MGLPFLPPVEGGGEHPLGRTIWFTSFTGRGPELRRQRTVTGVFHVVDVNPAALRSGHRDDGCHCIQGRWRQIPETDRRVSCKSVVLGVTCGPDPDASGFSFFRQQTGALPEKSGSLCAEPQRGPSPTVKSLKLTSPSSLPTAPPSAPRRSRPTGSPTRPTASEARTAPGAPQALLGLRGGGAVPCALLALGVCAVGKSPSQTSEPVWSPLLARGTGSPPAGPAPASPVDAPVPPPPRKTHGLHFLC